MSARRQAVSPRADRPNALSRICWGKISVAIVGAIGPFDQLREQEISVAYYEVFEWLRCEYVL